MYLSKASCMLSHTTRESENRNFDYILNRGAVHTKTVLLMFVLVLLISGTASALTQGPLNCTPFPTTFMNGNGGPNAVSCPPFTMAGTLTGVTLNYLSDYQFGSNPG